MKTPRSKSAKTEFRILAMLAFFSISCGLWNNFRQLWLGEQGFIAQETGSVMSLGILISATSLFFIGFILRPKFLKAFVLGVLVVKLIDLALLFGMGQGFFGANPIGLIKLASVIDILTTNLIVTSIYPLITTVIKSDRAYSRRKLVEYLFVDFGVLIGAFAIGQSFAGIVCDYSAMLFLSILFLIPAIAVIYGTRITPSTARPVRYESTLKCITGSRLQLCFMLYVYLANTSWAAALGLKMLMLTDFLHFSANTATNYFLILGFLSDIVGIVALRYFTPKNDYLTIFLKFGLRLAAYVIAILAGGTFFSLLAITWSILISCSFENVTDGHYVNLIDNRHQLGYGSIRCVMSYLGEATGMLLCGLMFSSGLSAIFGIAAAVTAAQLVVACRLVHLRYRRRTVRHSASRLRYHERTIDKS